MTALSRGAYDGHDAEPWLRHQDQSIRGDIDWSPYQRLHQNIVGRRAIDPDDPELLADMIQAAVNEALRSATADGVEDVEAHSRRPRGAWRVAPEEVAIPPLRESPFLGRTTTLLLVAISIGHPIMRLPGVASAMGKPGLQWSSALPAQAVSKSNARVSLR